MDYQGQPFQALMDSFKLIGMWKVTSKKDKDFCISCSSDLSKNH